MELPAAVQLVRAWTALPPRLRDPDTARALIALAGLVDLRDLRGKVDQLLGALAPEVTDADLAAARETGELVLVDVGAQTRLSGHTDALTGEWLRELLQAKAQADRALADARPPATPLLDALLDCLRAATSTPAVPGSDSADPTLVVLTTVDDLLRTAHPRAHPASAAPEDALTDLVADLSPATDPTEPTPAGAAGAAARGGGTGPTGPADAGAGAAGPRWTTRTRAGLPLGPRTLAGLCCTARLTRLVLDPLGHPLDSSPAARQLSRRERRALEHRADHRCERTGCGRPAAVCVPHHVIPWALGGPSTQANTVLLCRACHHLLHDRDRALDLTGDRRIGPHGWVRGGPAPP